ncbi:MAG TPA: aminoacyl-tRNA hydrolase [Candidatus Eisenbacteria bacterium]|nr:aminoacyl-tRNA hydrolase [Candidatus Eisenbacteria bacterium]
MSKTFIIAGLGNPGKKYERSWHNCGYMVLEILSQRHDFTMRKIKFKSLCAEINLYGQKIIFLQPTTFMNNSGESIRAAVDFYKIPLENLLVIYDDIDIDVGKIRIRPWGSPGSHNGMRSIVKHLNDDNFPRIRVGIGPQVEGIDIVKYVLQSVPIDKQKMLFEGLNKAADAVEIILQDTLDLAMNRLNGV